MVPAIADGGCLRPRAPCANFGDVITLDFINTRTSTPGARGGRIRALTLETAKELHAPLSAGRLLLPPSSRKAEVRGKGVVLSLVPAA